MLDESKRHFTPGRPIYCDLFGGVIVIVSTCGSDKRKDGVPLSLIGIRYQMSPSDDLEAEAHTYTVNGRWHFDSTPAKWDLWDADLETLKPFRGKLYAVAS